MRPAQQAAQEAAQLGAEKKREAADAAAKKKQEAEAERLEAAAAAKLRGAEAFLKAGKVESYRSTLQDLVKKYPNTKAAEKARKALK